MAKDKKIKYVTLPYDFIKFPQKWISYSKEFPRHDQTKQLNGYIKYKLIPQSDLALEIRKGKDEKLFVSGSQFRGTVRGNAEILSQNYPHFINDSPMFYRDMINNMTNKELVKQYREKLCIRNGIEKDIEVGFLRKDNINFYIVPAEKWFSGKNFISIKEHKIRNMKIPIGINISMLYDTNAYLERSLEIDELQNNIDKLTKEIFDLRKKLKNELSSVQKEINNIFTKEFGFLKIGIFDKPYNADKPRETNESDFTKRLDDKAKDLWIQLKSMCKSNNKLEIFCLKMVERWKLKAKIHNIYITMKPNEQFKPYQEEVYYKENSNGGIEKISKSGNGEFVLKGYLFNSTNASSKRSHYFIKEPFKTKERIIVPQNVIGGYQQNISKSRDKDNKWFYDIFNEENKTLIEKNPEGPIVFFKRSVNGKVKMIGRTPYFKVPYNRSIKEIIEKNGKSTIGYADALFGFVSDINVNPENQKDIVDSYKSRVRFTPIDIKGNFKESDYKSMKFLLPSPFASANAMYIQQKGEKLSTYNDEDTELNGYKYYRILDKVQKSKTEPKDMISVKGIMKNNNNFYLEGKVYFKNLACDELGLLLLSMDIEQTLNSKQYKGKNKSIIEKSFEQIGGAKPYGYGKVKVDITEFYLENNDASFESLITNSIKKIDDENRQKYIDAYFNTMENKESNYFDRYIESKQEVKRENLSNGNSIMIDWYNVQENIQKYSGNKGGGYPANWRIDVQKNKN